MNTTTIKQGTIKIFDQDAHLLTWLNAFMVDRKAQNMSAGTLDFYQKKLKYFAEFCDGQAITLITQIDAPLIREFLLWLENKDHNPGGIHAAYRSLRTFLNWWENKIEPEGWKNPIGVGA